MIDKSTMPELYRPLMDGTSVELPYCAVCGRSYPLNRHHIVKRSAGKLFRFGVEVPKPTIMLCGSGNTGGCHGLAHSGMLHFRWVVCDNTSGTEFGHYPRASGGVGGHWEFLKTEEPTKYQTALNMDGWQRLPEFGW